MHAALRSFVVATVVIAASVSPSVAQVRKSPNAPDFAQRLAQPVTLELADLALKDLPNVLRKKCRLDVEVDLPALAAVEVDENLKLSLNVRDTSLRSALRLLLQPHELGWVTRGEALVITTADKARVTRLYSADDLMPWSHHAGYGSRDVYSLIALIQERTWDGASAFGSVLVVSETEDVHHEVQLLLSALRLAGKPLEVAKPPEPTPASQDADPFGAPAQPARANPFGGQPVRRVVRKPRTAPIPVQLTWGTTSDRGEDAQVTVVYPVSDLVSDLALDQDGAEELMDMLTQIEHDSWQDGGGSGSIKYFEPTRAMLVRNSRRVHKEITDVLTKLRDARGPRAAEMAGDRRQRWDDELVWQGFRWRNFGDPPWASRFGFGGGMGGMGGGGMGGMFSVEDAAPEESQSNPPRPAPLSQQERKCLRELIVDILPSEKEKTPGALILVREHEVLVRHRRAIVIDLERTLSDAPVVRTLNAHWFPKDSSGISVTTIPVVGENR